MSQEAAVSPSQACTLKLFGDFQARDASNAPIEVRARKTRAALLILSTKPGGTTRDYLAGLLWPQAEDRLAKQNLRQVLSDIRSLFGMDALNATTAAVQLEISRVDTDVSLLEALKHNTDRISLEQISKLYAGPFGADFHASEEELDSWLSSQRRSYEEIAVTALDRLVDLYIREERFAEGLTVANRLLAIEPLREATHRQLLKLELAVHGRGRALARFDELSAMLRRELDVEPEPETRRLVEAIRAIEPPAEPDNHAQEFERLSTSANRGGLHLPRNNTRYTKPALLAATLMLVVFALGAGGVFHFFRANTPHDQRIVSTIIPKEAEAEPLDGVSQSIVVLPFGAQPDDERMSARSEGLSLAVNNLLAGSPQLAVINYQTAQTYRNSTLALPAIAGQLDIKYAVQGTLQTESDRIVAYVKLMDPRSQIELWAGRFELNQTTAASIADEIAIAIGRRIERAIERKKLRRAPNDTPEVAALLRQGNSILNATLCGRLDPKAKFFFSEALRKDPNSARAMGRMANYLLFELANVRLENPAESIAEAERLAVRALEIAPEDGAFYFALGLVRRMQARHDESLAAFEKSLEFEPNLAATYAQIGYAKMLLGRFEETENLIRRSIRLNPRGPANCIWATVAGMANFYLERDEQALAWFNKAIELGPHIPRNHQFVAAIHALRGDRAKAIEHVNIMLGMSPPTTLKHIRSYPGLDTDVRYQKQRKRFMHGAELAFGFAGHLEHRGD